MKGCLVTLVQQQTCLSLIGRCTETQYDSRALHSLCPCLQSAGFVNTVDVSTNINMDVVFTDTQDKIKGDKELQKWGRELAAPKESGGAGIKVRHGTLVRGPCSSLAVSQSHIAILVPRLMGKGLGVSEHEDTGKL